MTDLDDRITGRVLQAENLRGDTDLRIGYTDQVAGKITFFELSPLVASLRSLLLAARPARPTDYTVPAAGGTLDPHGDDGVDLPRTRPQAVRDALNGFLPPVSTFLSDLGALLADPPAAAQRRGHLPDPVRAAGRHGRRARPGAQRLGRAGPVAARPVR
jgi:hypothetical protein